MMRFLEASRRSNDSAMNYSRNTVAIKEQGCCLEKRNGKQNEIWIRRTMWNRVEYK